MSYINPGLYPVTVSDKDQPRPAVISPALLCSPLIIIIIRPLPLSLFQVAMTPQDGSFQFSLTSPSNCPLLLQLSLLLISLIKKCSICILNEALWPPTAFLNQENKKAVWELSCDRCSEVKECDKMRG